MYKSLKCLATHTVYPCNVIRVPLHSLFIILDKLHVIRVRKQFKVLVDLYRKHALRILAGV